MGADGHIRILDVEKFIAQQKLSEDEFVKFFDLIKDSTTYLHQLPGQEPRKRCITVYSGDNLYHCSLLYNLVVFAWNKGDWEDPFYFDAFLQEIDKSPWSQDEVLSMARFLWSDCYGANWEVWT